MKPVVLFYASEPDSEANCYAAALALHGYELRQCHSTAALRMHVRRALEEARQSGEPVLAVLANATPLNRAAASILASLPQVGVLALLDSYDDAALVAALQLGIDAWFPRNCSPEVLALALHNVMRRLERGSGMPSPVAPEASPKRPAMPVAAPVAAPPIDPPSAVEGHWLLRDQAWVLETPAGRQLPLTSSERNFMLALLRQPDQAANHADLLHRRGQRQADAQTVKRRLGVLVSRLRRKAAVLGDELPLKSLHNWGYMFTGNLSMAGSTPQANRKSDTRSHETTL